MRRAWTPEDTATLEQMRGRPDREIAEAMGKTLRQVADRRRLLGLKSFAKRSGWTRRDWLLNDAAGLDFLA